jgi:thymidylate kinase
MPFIVFFGLPGSGKSTVARDVAERVQLPVLDKDDFLEALFAERGPGDAAWRTTLSREADERFAAAARELPGACLVSWWRPPHIDNPSGTPAEWLAELRAPLVQVHCICRVETAVERFLSRRRHPGHLDSVRSRESLLREFAELAGAVPIPDGVVIEVNTEQSVDIGPLMERILAALGM